MKTPSAPPDETRRLRAMQSVRMLDTLPEERFDRITRLACHMFGVPIALVTMLDEERQWFKSRVGIEATETSRDVSFCGHAILNQGPMVVPDSLRDPRFADNPLVTDDPNIRFYAGHPVHAPDGSPIGTLCIIDRKPRQITKEELEALSDLASMVDREFSLVTLASIDELTQLSNRRGLAEIATHVLALCRRSGQPATLLAIDLNGFKQVNDTQGHAAGDDVLREFGRLLLKHFRASDVVARMGGDEFCVLCGGVGMHQIGFSIKRFTEAFAGTELARRYPGVSWSAGVAEFDPGSEMDVDTLLAAADRLMYEAKAKSKER